MKNERLHTALCAGGISFCLGLGAVGSMVTGLNLPVELGWLVFWCAIVAAVITGLSCLNYGTLLSLGLIGIFLLNPDLWTELKTIAAVIYEKLNLAYGFPIPQTLQEELSHSVLSAMCLWSAVTVVAAVWAVQKQKSSIPAALLSLVPLGCCITVVDTVPDSVWLFFWGFGLVLLLLTQWTRKQNASRGNLLTALVALPVALVLLCLFWLVPRDAPNRWGVAELPSQILGFLIGPSEEGMSDVPGPKLPPKVDLSALEERQQRQTPVMEVIADFTGPLYLRGQDYDQYSGTGWQSGTGRTEELYGFQSQWHQKDGTVKIQVRQAVDLYYLPAITQQKQLLTDGQAKNPDLEKSYQFDHCSFREDWQTTWEDPGVYTVNPRYLDLPEETSEEVWVYLSNYPELMNAMVSNLSAPNLAEQIGQHLREHVPYNLETPNMPQEETDLAVWFLNRAQSGYCVHYATTAAVLLRACGIPARYVEGYAVYAVKDRTVTVRELHAHAWVEYYVNGVGWMILDATPEDGTVPQEPTPTTPDQTQPVTTTQPTEPQPSATVPEETQPQPGQTRKPLPVWVQPLLLSLACALAAVLLWGQYRLRRRLFAKVIGRGTPNQRSLVIHRRLCRLSKWTGHPVSPALTQLAQKARFSPHTLTKQELSQLRDNLKQAESAVAKLTLIKRLTAKWVFALY